MLATLLYKISDFLNRLADAVERSRHRRARRRLRAARYMGGWSRDQQPIL